MIFNTFIMNKKILLISLGVLSFATAMQARSRSVEEAKQVAADFYQNQNGLRAASAPELTLVYSGSESGLRSSASEAPFYVFNIGSADGFVMVSGDDRVAPVIGYSLTSVFNPDNMPGNLRGWLEGYEKQIAYARTLPDKPYEASETRAGEFPESVGPLITTQWNQGAPYNNTCPMDGDERTLTGCVATAMAQIMNYHEWPEKAEGTGSYILKSTGDTTSVPDMSIYTFDWKNMADTYGEDATEEQNAAVAELMEACGASVQMQYGTIASSAYDADAAGAFIRNMGYDKNVSFVIRDAYTNEEWKNLLKTELQEKRPILYGGNSHLDGGHAFICDGYDANDFFHMNWGWGNLYLGYFNINILNPAGESNDLGYTGFTSQQDAVIGIQRPTEGSVNHGKMLIRSFAPEKETIPQDSILNFSISVGYATGLSQDFEIGFDLRKGNYTRRHTVDKTYSLPSGSYYFPNIPLTTSNFSIDPGTYEVQFIYREAGAGDDAWKDAAFSYGSMYRNVYLIATEDEITWAYEGLDLTAKLVPDKSYYDVETNEPVGLTYSITNNGNTEYHPTMGFIIESEKMDATVWNYDKLYLAPNETQEYGVVWGFSLKPGNYTIYLLAHDQETEVNSKAYIISQVTWEVDDPTPNETISANDFSIRVYSDRIAVQSASPVRQIELFDIAGRLAGNIRAANELPVDGVAAGVYIVRVTTDEGVQTEKVILH